MRVLLDTCVLSELQRPHPDPRVRERVSEISSVQLYVSVITLGEISKGVHLLADSRRKQEIREWLLALELRFTDQILDIDHEVARIWGEQTARAQVNGLQIPVTDGLIAATAIRHGLHVMTRNTRHFVATGAMITDPWAE